MKRLPAALVAVVALTIAGCAPAQGKPKPATVAAEQYAKVYIGAKVDQAGTDPAPASSAAAVGSAQMFPADTSRTITVQYRTAGSSAAWTTLQAGKPASSGYVYFRAWSQFEYRATLSAYSGVPAVTSPVQGYEWTQTFSDEFSGTDLDSTVWSGRGQSYTTGMTRAHGDPSAVDVSGGAAHLRAIADPDNPGNYLDGHVGTEDTYQFTNGWAAARVRFHRLSGSHAAFWLQSDPGYVPGAAEVDVAEDFGGTNPTATGAGTPLYRNVYYDWSDDGGANLTNVQGSVTDAAQLGSTRWWNSYHVFSVRWTTTQYQFYIDSTKVQTVTQGVSSKPEFLVLSMLTRDYEVNSMQDSQLSTYSMDVDWVRVWQ